MGYFPFFSLLAHHLLLMLCSKFISFRKLEDERGAGSWKGY
jgi:hypothetical protein